MAVITVTNTSPPTSEQKKTVTVDKLIDPSALKPLNLKNWINGQLIQATIIEKLSNQTLLLEVGKTRLTAKTDIDPPAAGVLQLKVVKSGEQPQLQLVSTKPAGLEADKISQAALRQALPKQVSLSEFFIGLKNPATKTEHSLPSSIRLAIQQIHQHLPSRVDLLTPQGVKKAIAESGHFFEANLARLKPDQSATQQANPLQRSNSNHGLSPTIKNHPLPLPINQRGMDLSQVNQTQVNQSKGHKAYSGLTNNESQKPITNQTISSPSDRSNKALAETQASKLDPALIGRSDRAAQTPLAASYLQQGIRSSEKGLHSAKPASDPREMPTSLQTRSTDSQTKPSQNSEINRPVVQEQATKQNPLTHTTTDKPLESQPNQAPIQRNGQANIAHQSGLPALLKINTAENTQLKNTHLSTSASTHQTMTAATVNSGFLPSIRHDLKGSLLQLVELVRKEQTNPQAAPTRPHDPATRELPELHRQVESALARLQFNQLNSLTNHDQNTQAFLLELPIRDKESIEVLDLKIEQQESQQDQAAQDKRWAIRLTFDLEGLGPIHARLVLGGEQIQASLWAEQEGTFGLINDHLDQLRQRLHQADFIEPMITCYCGKPQTDQALGSNSNELVNIQI